uniref:Uncharacterized protein n=1 Tax=Brassica oleracea TaxID=3712 RepID=A0A3P6FBE0_BRAOL|nr:unnamed protein product [Brassica oleracea]
MFDQSSLFFESCQVLCDQNSTFLLILRVPNARLEIHIIFFIPKGGLSQ